MKVCTKFNKNMDKLHGMGKLLWTVPTVALDIKVLFQQYVRNVLHATEKCEYGRNCLSIPIWKGHYIWHGSLLSGTKKPMIHVFSTRPSSRSKKHSFMNPISISCRTYEKERPTFLLLILIVWKTHSKYYL